MPKPIARRKTKKAVAKRFKVTATGKVLRGHAGRRHFLVSKSAKRKRHLAKGAVVDKTDEARIKENLPFKWEKGERPPPVRNASGLMRQVRSEDEI